MIGFVGGIIFGCYIGLLIWAPRVKTGAHIDLCPYCNGQGTYVRGAQSLSAVTCEVCEGKGSSPKPGLFHWFCRTFLKLD